MARALPVLGAAALLSLALAAPAAAQQAQAQVSLLHGIPGTPVDVYVNGARALDDFQPGTITGDLGLAAGTYRVAVFAADAADASGTPVIGPVDLAVPATGNVSVIAHLTATGTPTLTPYVNDTAATPAGQGRLVVRHDAAAPTVDVLAGGQPALTGITNPGEKSAELPAGTISASVAATGTTTPVIGPADVNLLAGRSTIVYAIGSLQDKTLGLLVQTVQVGGGPSGAAAGSGGLLDDEAVPTPVVLASGLGALVAAAGAIALARTRQPR